jgi:hypothetical protein
MQLDGIGNGHGGNGGERANMTDEVINSALRYRVQAPMVDSLLADIGIEGGNLTRQGGLIREAADMQRIASEARREARSGGGAEGGSGGGGASGGSGGSGEPPAGGGSPNRSSRARAKKPE